MDDEHRWLLKEGGWPYNFKHMEKQEMQTEWNLKHKVEMEKGNIVI